MARMPHWQNLFSVLREHDIHVSEHDMPRPVAGGDISDAWCANAADRPVFLKTGPASAFAAFAAEAQGLRELAAASALRVPQVLGCIRSGNEALLALEWLEFELASPQTERLLGARLAALHRVCSDRFGFHSDNTIGATPQLNQWSKDWVGFYAEQRIRFQLNLAARNGFDGALQVDGHRLAENVCHFFKDYWPEASLLHGDLWGGNWGACNGEPVIFDPAVYYGDREADIAMTKLFGGFGRDFFAAYEDAWPLDAGNEARVALYQLYHVLNHLNLFGSAYLGRAESLIKTLLQ